jgi:hypothetical protein
MTTLWKVLVIAGGFLLGLGPIGVAGGIYKSFASLKTNELAGIGAVGGGIELALVSAILSVIGLLLLVAGMIAFVVNKSRSTDNHPK